ncbi:MAG: hypothetical protein Q9M82_01400 [Mariprofundus sp.]|nr:hypothetical protein [Mariprofundus sp.]
MEYFKIHVFKSSFAPIVGLLNEHKVKYQMREIRSGEIMASSGVIEVLQSAAIWGALASIIIAFVNNRNGRKVIITTKDNRVIHAEGLNSKELESIIKQSKYLLAIDPSQREEDESKT